MTHPLLRTLRLPVVAAPMFLVSGPEMVIAAAMSGIVGAFPTPNCRTSNELDEWMTRITAQTRDASGLWAANLVTHSSNRRLADDLALVDKHRPPVVITALGSPAPAIATVHDYGGIVLADVVDERLGRKAAAAGADGLVAVASGAGGHTGSLSPFAFVSVLRDFFDGIVCVGGGMADGAAVAGAVAAGADLVYMGTRFLAAEESMAANDYKRMVIAAGAEDLVVSPSITGTAASWLKPSLAAAGYDVNDLGHPPSRDYGGDPAAKWRDLWAAGQGLHTVTAIEPVARIVDVLDTGWHAARARLASIEGDRNMTPEEIEAFAQQFVDAVQAGDAETMRACYAPGAKIWHNTDGIEQTIDDNVKVLEWFVRTLPDRTYTVQRRETLPDGFVQQHILSATLPDGTPWSMDACVVVRMADGRITRLDEYMDSAAGAKLRAFGR